MNRICVLVLAGLLAACATRGGFEKTMNAWVGSSESALVSGLGPPSSFYVAPDGTRVLSYMKSGNMTTGGATTYQPVTSTTTGNIGTRPISATTTTYQPVQQPSYNVSLSCTVNFTIRNDQVQSWQANGNHCVN